MNFVEVKDGKVAKVKGKLRRGHWVICLDGCGVLKILKRKPYSRDIASVKAYRK